MLQAVCKEVALTPPSFVLSATDKQTISLVAITNRVGNDLRTRLWPKLNKTHTITLVAGQAAYALPADFDQQVFDTHWDTQNRFPLWGPVSNSTWELIQNSLVSTSQFDRKFILKGMASNQFYIDPVPSASDAGQIMLFEYQSVNWIRPKTWTASTVFAAATYCFYNGYYFYTSAGGVTGTTPPTPSGLNDGGITWSEFTEPYTEFTADTDEFNIEEALVGLGVQWNYLASRGLPYQHLETKYKVDESTSFTKARGATKLSLVPGRWRMGRPWPNVRETGFG